MAILTGTATWTDKPLVDSGKFYPRDANTPEKRLRYYASRYPLVEVDSSYYGLPTPEMGRAWVDRTPDGFTFDVKAYSLFTEHPSPVSRLPKELREALPPDMAAKKNLYRKDTPPEIVDAAWRTFVDALLPLHDAGKLGVVVFQFPKWVFPNRRTYRYLEEIVERLGPFRAVVEFRSKTWMEGDERESALNTLGGLGISYICVDEPQGFASSVPPVAAATANPAYVRFHGRNAAMWEKRTRTSAERFDYWYSADELDEWVPKIRQLALEVPDVHLVMNTNNDAQGPVNADLLAERLRDAGLVVVGA